MKHLKLLSISILYTLLCACSGFFDKDNTPTPSPLVNYKQEVSPKNIWSTSTNGGVGSEYLKLVPAVTDRAIFTASKEGDVTATDRTSGKTLWKTATHVPISGGPAAHDNVVVIGSREGDVIGLRQSDGAQLWKAKVSSEVLASPAISQNISLVKSIDGHLTALSVENGQTLWKYQQTEPTLILRSASAPQIIHDNIIVGFANGTLAKLTLQSGSLYWDQLIAIPQGSFTIQRMVDIDADPIVLNHRIYAATYQGRIAALDFSSGKMIWNYDISSYSGIAADPERVYVSDAKSHIWAFDAESGRVDWRQSQLEARNTTGPAVMGNYIVVGDEEGYLHWLNKQDGRFVGRVRVDRSGILATPVVSDNTLYVVTKSGYLAAYRLS